MPVNVSIELATAEHRSSMLHLIKSHYVKVEPMLVAMDKPWNQEHWERVVDAALNDGHSHIAVDTVTGNVVGFCLSRMVDLDLFRHSSIFETDQSAVRDFLDKVTLSWRRIFDEAGCTRFLQLRRLCVSDEYGGKGLAGKLCIENMKFAKENGCTHCTTLATSYLSQRVFEKLGFRELSSVDYSDLRGVDGEILLKMNDPLQKSMKWYLKEL